MKEVSWMEFQQLLYFIMLAEIKNFTKASEKLFVSQPALSKSITRLEDELDVALIKREGKQISLTEEGKIFYRHSKKIITDIKSAKTELYDISRKYHPTIRIKVCALTGIMPDIIHDFILKNPGVKFELRYGDATNYNDIEYDFIINSTPRTFSSRNKTNILREDLLLISERRNECDGNMYSIEELNEKDMIFPSQNCYYYETVSQLLKKKEIKPNVVAYSDDPVTILELVKKGVGISLMPEYSMPRSYKDEINIRVPNDRNMCRTITLHSNNYNYISTDVRSFGAFIQKYVNNLHAK